MIDHPFPNYEVENPTATTPIWRSIYTIAGQTIATRVSGDLVSGNNGISYFYNDHLGSNTALRKPDGSRVATYYLPFGGYREGSGSNQVTDRGFTGHKHNDDLGLVYMNARFYVSGIGRFASADSLVPDPANPQQYNRYTYGLNNPLRYSDPTGHCAENGDEACWAIWEALYRQMYDENAETLWGMPEFWEHLGNLSESELKTILFLVNEGELGVAVIVAGRPEWNPDEDYTTGEVSIGVWVVGVSVAVTKDKYGNIYFGVGGNLGKSFPTFASVRVVKGWRLSRYESSEIGLQDYLRGLSLNLGGGWLPGLALTTNFSGFSGEFGGYSPHAGISLSLTGRFYDNHSTEP